MAIPKPTPTKLKLLRGNPGKRKIKPEPEPAAIKPDRPAYLDDVAAAEWDRISDELFTLGLLTRLDATALAMYCVAFSRWSEADEMIRKDGLILYSDKTGAPYSTPWVNVANKAIEQMHTFLTEFGMTPSSRSKVHAAPAKDALDEFEAFTQKRG